MVGRNLTIRSSVALAAVLSIGAWSAASAAEPSAWTDIRINRNQLAVRVANGDVECASDNGRDCLWGVPATAVATRTDLVPLACGAHYQAVYGTDGYSESGSWCSAGHARLAATWRFALAPAPAPTPLFYSTNADGDVQCLSFNGRTCEWNMTALYESDRAAILPLTCGAMHQAVYGGPGDTDPTHWCSVIRRGLTRFEGVKTVDPDEYSLSGITIGGDDVLYALDRDNNIILRKPLRSDDPVTWFTGQFDASGGYVDGPASVAQFNSPTAIARDRQGNLYVADTGNNAIRKVAPEGTVSTIAARPWNRPLGIAVAPDGTVAVADTASNVIVKIAPDGTLSHLAGSGYPGFRDGAGTEADFNRPTSLAFDRRGNLHVVDTFNHRIRKITPDGVVTTLAGSPQPGNRDGNGANASFRFVPVSITDGLHGGFEDVDFPLSGMTFDNHGNLLVLDVGNDVRYPPLRVVTPAGEVTTTETHLSIEYASSLAVDSESDLHIGSAGSEPLVALVPALQ